MYQQRQSRRPSQQHQAQQTQDLYMQRGPLEIATNLNQVAPKTTKNGGGHSRKLEKVSSVKNATSTTNLGLLKRTTGSLRNIGMLGTGMQQSNSA